MVPADLRSYPQLLALHSDIGQPPLVGLPIAELFDGQAFRHQLDQVEQALNVLAVRPVTDVAEQKGKLFIAGWAHWDATWLELLAFSSMQRDGSLDATGWPSTGYGNSPPFDGVLKDTNGQHGLIAFDVKSAAGSGITLLQERFQTIADGWSAQHQLGLVAVAIKTAGVILTREVVGPELGQMLGELRNALQQQTRLPATYSRAMPNGGTVTATIDEANDVTMNFSVGPPADRTRSALAIMEGHVRSKAVFAQRHQRPFVLIYVRPTGAGAADASSVDIVSAARQLDLAKKSDWWLGTLLLDFSGVAPKRHGYLRTNGHWPIGSTQQTLSATLLL